VRPRPGVRHLLPWTAAVLAIVAAATMARVAPQASKAEVLRFSMAPPARTARATLAPDGRRVMWLAQERGETRLFVQSLDSLAASEIDGTEGAQSAFWSPDSRSIGFFAGGKLKRVAVSGGLPVTIAAAPFGLGGAWNRDGTIVFAPDRTGGLVRVRVEGGPPLAVTGLDRAGGETSHRWPVFLPDGRRFLYLSVGANRGSGVLHAGSLQSEDRVVLGHADSGAIYTPDGYLLFVLNGTLMAQRFDPGSLRLRDDPIAVARGTAQDPVDRSQYFSASDTGMLLYHSLSMPESRLMWFDRAGRTIGTAVVPGVYGDPSIAPDASSVAFARLDPSSQTSDIWRVDLVRGGLSRVTAANATVMRPVWSPRSDQILFTLRRNQMLEMYRVASTGGAEQLVQRSATNQIGSDWRVDSRFILYENSDPKTKSDLWLLPQSGTQTPVPYLRTPFNETRGRFSPDGRWVSYTSDESGTQDVYIQAFPPSTKKWQVSVRGGTQGIWRADGREILYLAQDRTLMAVPVRHAGSALELGAATPLFQVPDGRTWDARFSYAVSPDGQRFLVNVATTDGPIHPLSATAVVNWAASLPHQP
jgi:Tol biopolymer transport system component